jgi:GNAT superfamily N-acetyltransferase
MITEALTKADVDAGFDCGEPALDEYFRRHALGNSERGIGRAFVLRSPDGDGMLPPIIGFYTLSMAHLERESLPDVHRKKLPRYPMPVALIGRLAVDRKAQGAGFGRALLRDAIDRVVNVSSAIGCLGLIVDAKNEAAETFYRGNGFLPVGSSSGWPRRLFRAIDSLRPASP